MKRWVHWAAWLYPAGWRVRYGAEFDVLLNDAPLRWSDLGDVIRGALIMRMTGWMTYRKMALLSGLAGLLMAAGIAFAIQDQYVCAAALAIESPGGTVAESQQALALAARQVLSREALTSLVKDLDLYKAERQHSSAEQAADGIFRKHLHVVPYAYRKANQHFRIVFSYPDRYKAKVVVDRLTAAFQQALSAPGSPSLYVLEGAILPQVPTSPARLAIVILGLIAGVAMGLISLAVWRRTRTYAVVTVGLPRDAKTFVDSQIAAGQYRSVSEYIGELIRAEEQRHK